MNTGLLTGDRTEWDAWLASLMLAAPEQAARELPCRSCGARYREPCLSATGLMASQPCTLRVADAAQMQERTEGDEAA